MKRSRFRLRFSLRLLFLAVALSLLPLLFVESARRQFLLERRLGGQLQSRGVEVVWEWRGPTAWRKAFGETEWFRRVYWISGENLTLRNLDSHIISSLSSLRAIGLADSDLLEANFGHQIGHHPALESVYIARCSISDGDVAEISTSATIENLALRYCGVTDNALLGMKPMPRLRQLYLDGSAVSSLGIGALGRHPELERLDLSDVSLDDQLAEALMHIKTLKIVVVCQDAVGEEELEEVRRRNPGLAVVEE